MRERAATNRLDGQTRRCARGGYSLLELLVVVAIISLMVGLLGGTLGKVRGAARSFECKNKLKSVAFEFFQFADDFGTSYRRSPANPTDKGFAIDTFQEKLYGVNRYWSARTSGSQTYDPSRQLLMCPAGPKKLERHPDLPCDQYPVTPVENVTIAFNMRLRSASAVVGNRPVLKEVRLSSRILRQPSVPLAFDVEAPVAAARRILPYYSAPPAGDQGQYGKGQFWFPSMRHTAVNACFVGGHVLSSAQPEKASGWNWRFQPQPE